MIDLPPGVAAADVVELARADGVLLSQWHATRVRAVWHLDAPYHEAERAARTVGEAIVGAARNPAAS
jgi:hypothetical protein